MTARERPPKGDSGPTGPEPVTPKAQLPSGAVERVVRALRMVPCTQCGGVCELEDGMDAVECRCGAFTPDYPALAIAALRAAPAASPPREPCNPDTV